MKPERWQQLDRLFHSALELKPTERAHFLSEACAGNESLRREVERCPGVELHADVPDVRPYLAASGLLAVPLRVGGGSRLKILEALASGLPVVSTRIGAEGLALEPGVHLEIVPDVGAMADAILAAMSDPRRAQAQAEAGRRRVLERYDWDVLAGQMEQAWVRCVTRHSKPGAQTREIP